MRSERLFPAKRPKPKRYQAIDASGKIHKRSTVNRTYTHCVVIHYRARASDDMPWLNHPAYDATQWAGRRELAERVAARHRQLSSVESVEILPAVLTNDPPRDFDQARNRIALAERDLQRALSLGERRDLLRDNFPWPADYCDAIVEQIARWENDQRSHVSALLSGGETI